MAVPNSGYYHQVQINCREQYHIAAVPYPIVCNWDFLVSEIPAYSFPP